MYWISKVDTYRREGVDRQKIKCVQRVTTIGKVGDISLVAWDTASEI